MVNKEELLASFQEDLKLYKVLLQKAKEQIVSKGHSLYPIFIAHQGFARMGTPLVLKDEKQSEWNINASFIEEFIQRKIISDDKKEIFKQRYTKSKDSICVFLIVQDYAEFVFVD